MNEKDDIQYQRMIRGDLYHQDEALFELNMRARDKIFEYNQLRHRDLKKRQDILESLLGETGKNIFIEIPLQVDYGFNIHVGDNFFGNNNLTLADAAPIHIGDNVLIGPYTGIYTGGHSIDPDLRTKEGAEYAFPVTIGDNVWIGANVTITPGATIGENSVIGAGSVITKDIPANVVAFGNPAKVAREINENDKTYYYKKRKTPEEFLDKLNRGDYFYR
ncbi:sugar O-acetyltransferase [Leuconostoc pseudomesenteroides]|uniref:sugar O-acetyltransferase n=1 Tax=Leuconostoc pseudomesenteroides TaxID=33968 RepID=UPI0032DE6505